MTRLALRLAFATREAIAGLALTALAVAVGTAVLLFALSFVPAVEERGARTAWRGLFEKSADEGVGTLVLRAEDRVQDRTLLRIHVAPAGGGEAPIPPGIRALPDAGTAFVSPALADLIADLPRDQLGDRIGRVIGSIAPESLASPDDLVAVIGTDAEILRATGAGSVSRFETQQPPLALPPVGALIVVLAAAGALAPVGVFVSTITRMSAARRETRLAAMRLVGATPGQTAWLAAIEALVATAFGSLAGILLFIAARPVVARIPLDAATWWPDTIVPPLPAAVALLLLIQVVGVCGALVTMRRLAITPLGVQRRSTPPPPRAWRVLPVVVSVAVLFVAVIAYRDPDGREGPALIVAGIAFAGIIGGIALAGPWLTAIVGRLLHRFARGAASLLAARRLGDQPHASFGAIAGAIMAVFVASAFFTFAAYSRGAAGGGPDPLLRSDGAVAFLVGPTGAGRVVERVRGIEGVTAAVPVRDVALLQGDGVQVFGWIVACGDVVRVLALDGGECAASGVTTMGGSEVVGRYELFPDVPVPQDQPITGVPLVIAPGAATPLLPVPPDFTSSAPVVLIEPRALADPAAAARFPVTRIYLHTNGAPDVADRIRTAVGAALPAGLVRVADDRVGGDDRFEEIGRIVGLGLVGTLALAGCSLAVAVTTATLERRRQFVFLRSAGMSASTLRTTILLQAGIPLLAVAIVSAAIGVLVGLAVIWVAAETLAVPDASLVGIIALSVATAMGVVALTLPPLERMTRPTALRHE